jgi:hypothetical protein
MQRRRKLSLTEGWRRVKLMRRWFLRGVLALAGIGVIAPAASADETLWRTFRGRVTFSDVALAPESSFENPATMAAALRRIQRSSFEENAGFWRLHLIAFLDRPAATGGLVLRATDVTDPRAPREVRVFQVPGERGLKELRLDDFVVTETMGFHRGASYEITIEAAPETGGGEPETRKAGKADVYAKGVITLR